MYLNEKDIFRNIEASNRNSFKVKALVFSNYRLLQKLKGLGYSWGMIADAIQPCVEWAVKPDSLRSAYVSAVEYFSKPENEVPSPIAVETPEPASSSARTQVVEQPKVSNQPEYPSKPDAQSVPVVDAGHKTDTSPAPSSVKAVTSNKDKLLDAARRAKPSQSAGSHRQGLDDDAGDDLEAEIRKQRRLFHEASQGTPQNTLHSATESRRGGMGNPQAGVGAENKKKASESNSTDGSQTGSGTASGGKLMINANLM